jgi:hypothetical protein
MIGLHPPKRAIDIPEPYAQEYFDLFPIHAKLRSAEFPTTRNYLRITMANIHESWKRRRLDAPCRRRNADKRRAVRRLIGGPHAMAKPCQIRLH